MFIRPALHHAPLGTQRPGGRRASALAQRRARLRARRVDTRRPSIAPSINIKTRALQAVMPGLASRPLLKDNGFAHDPHVILGSKTPAHEPLPGVHRIAALLKRWFLGTHQGGVDPRHVDYYLDEFTFRFNRRTSRSRGLLFYRLIKQSTEAAPATYANIRDNPHPFAPAPGNQSDTIHS